jgi:small-conductance mechanosensitive channel
VKREAPLVSPAVWAAAAREAGPFGGAVQRHFTNWSAVKDDEGGAMLGVGALVAAFLGSFLLFGPVRDWSRKAFTARIEAHEPTAGRRVAVAGVKMLTRIIPGVIGGVIVIETSRAVGLLGAEGVPVARAIWIALIAYLLVDGFTSGLFAPSAPAWRLTPLDAAKGKRASMLLLSIVFVVGAKSVFAEIARLAGDTATLTHVAIGSASFIVGGLLFALSEKRLWTSKTETDQKNAEPTQPANDGIWPTVRFAGRCLGVLIMAAVIAGHVNLADFVSTRLYFFALLLAIAWFTRAALKEIAIWADRRLNAGRAGAAGKEESHTFQFWIGAGIDIALLVLVTPVLFVLAGVDASSVRDFFLRALVGFRVAGVVISLSDIFFAIAAFVGILFITRLLQGALQRGPFAHSRMDIGIQNSLTTLLGYGGLIVAAVIGLGLLGVNLTNLALIAGALSVGIGFGLQSIVKHFVSGLILLFERPIKAGDWIVTASGEGIVKKISVRSTELETFDRAAIIIPNSELIASTVTNWTHKSALGRISVPVGVSYDSDPELVREILLECANDHPLIVRYPEPFVVWANFGASSLDFEIRAFLSDISKGLQVRTDLRYAIHRAFKEKGIEIPFPQHDIHIKTGHELRAPYRRDAKPRSASEAPPHEQDDIDGADE